MKFQQNVFDSICINLDLNSILTINLAFNIVILEVRILLKLQNLTR